MKRILLSALILLFLPNLSYAYITTADAATTHYSFPFVTRGTFGWDDRMNDGLISLDSAVYILSEDVGETSIISTDVNAISNTVVIISNDAIDWTTNRVSTDAGYLSNVSSDAGKITTLIAGSFSIDGQYSFPTTVGTSGYVLSVDAAGTGLQFGVLGPAAGGATAALDNLSGVAINTSLISDTTNTDDLGSSAVRWKETFTVSADVAGHIKQTVGWHTNSAQPAFLVTPSATQADIAEGTAVTVAWGTEIYDQGGNFANNTFTAPVTGKYQLNVVLHLQAIDSAADYYYITIVTSNRSYIFDIDSNVDFSADAIASASFSVLADMDVTDTVYVTVTQEASGVVQTDIISNSFFSGFLAC